MAQGGLLFVVSGPSGVGKSSLCQAIVSVVPRTCLSISYTTRKPRPGEQHGREYFFVDEVEFREMIQRQEFVEWASVYQHLYGTPRNQLAQARNQGMDVVLDIDVQGARKIMATIDDAVSVFIMPPSLEALRTRLLNRAGDRWRKSNGDSKRLMMRCGGIVNMAMLFTMMIFKEPFRT